MEGNCYFSIENGSIEADEGRHAKPTVTIQTDFDLWMDILTGKADGQAMFFQEKYTVEGDLELMLKMEEMFGRENRRFRKKSNFGVVLHSTIIQRTISTPHDYKICTP